MSVTSRRHFLRRELFGELLCLLAGGALNKTDGVFLRMTDCAASAERCPVRDGMIAATDKAALVPMVGH